jgi:hypothetical protein
MVHADGVGEAPGMAPGRTTPSFRGVLQLRAEGERAVDFARIDRHDDRPPTLRAWEILDEG